MICDKMAKGLHSRCLQIRLIRISDGPTTESRPPTISKILPLRIVRENEMVQAPFCQIKYILNRYAFYHEYKEAAVQKQKFDDRLPVLC